MADIRKVLFLAVAVAVLVALGAACTPKTTSPAAPAPAPTAVPTSAPAPRPSAEDEAWAKVVAAAKKEGVVTIYTTAFVADIGARLTRDFRQQYGIRLEILSGNGRTLLERIRLEQSMKQPVADIFNIAGAGSTSELAMVGGGEKIADQLPALRNKDVFKIDPVYSPGGEVVTWVLSYDAQIINTKLVKPEDEPRTYKDILKPRWKGQILSSDPRTTGGGGPFYYVYRFHKVLDLDFYKGLAQQDVKMWGGNPREGVRMVGQGEYAMFIGATPDLVAPIIAEGAPLKPMEKEEGNAAIPGTIVVVKGAPHPNASRVFVNWLVSREGQTAYAESASSTPVRKDVPDFLHAAARISPKKTWLYSWDSAEWMNKDMAAKTMEQVFGRK